MHASGTFAIEIENRYRGLRSPQKLEGGVFACNSKHAAAKGKDFGLIALDGSWNLYVFGNAGLTPKHDVLLAKQLEDETVVKYLDRRLIFYIITVGPLARIAPWLDKLDSGIGALKQLIIEETLGIAQDLETEIQGLVKRFGCERKQAIENEEVMQRFKHFVNSDYTDDTLGLAQM